MQEQKAPKKLPFILIFIFADLILLGITLLFQKYASLGSFMASLTNHAWIVLLIAAFIALILSIILIKNYLTLRTALAECFMVLIFSFWFGIARIPIVNDGSSNNYILFTTGSIILLIVTIGIQIDLLCAPSIKNFLTTDKNDRTAAQPDIAQYNDRSFEEPDTDDDDFLSPDDFYEPDNFYEPAVIKEQPAAIHTSRKIQQPVQTASKPVHQTTEPEAEFRQTRIRRETLNDEQLQQFREYQAQRRAARMAAAKQMQNTSNDVLMSNQAPVDNLFSETKTSTPQKKTVTNGPLFFKDEQ